MSNNRRVVIAAAVAAAVIAVIAAKGGSRDQVARPEGVAGLPTLIELGSTTCVPCKMMVDVLDELREAYAGTLNVQFVDVYENRALADDYGIRVIPTQVLLDSEGREILRHEGFFSTEEIVRAFADRGIEL